MTSETRHAFEHPEARAAAMSAGRPFDRISLRDHVIEVEIGAFQAERGTLQRVRFDIVVEVKPQNADLADDVDRILSYDTLVLAIQAELAEERVNLLETLAERIADRVLVEPKALRAFVRIEKLDRGPGALGVEIVRSASGVHRLPEEIARDSAPSPRILFLGNAAMNSERLPRWLDRFESESAPLIVCVGPADRMAPKAASPAAQRRIDLLAIEQNAWCLAARDRRCIVTSTRAEFDWAQRNGQTTAWAPSKIVLDATDGPGAADAADLVRWFADQMNAIEIVAIGVGAPKTDISCRMVGMDEDL